MLRKAAASVYVCVYVCMCVYVCVLQHRSMLRKAAASRYTNKVHDQKSREQRKPEYTYETDPTDAVFQTG